MSFKPISLIVLVFLLAALPAYATGIDSKWLGTYESGEKSFVRLKRVILSQEKTGTVKARATLVGFPDEVSLGETTPEAYFDRNNKERPTSIIARFPSEKYKALVVIHLFSTGKDKVLKINCTCYMQDVDGSNIEFQGLLDRVEGASGK